MEPDLRVCEIFPASAVRSPRIHNFPLRRDEAAVRGVDHYTVWRLGSFPSALFATRMKGQRHR